MQRPLIIQDNEITLFGIYRGPEYPEQIVVFIPSLTGTRIGPQRMFVEISHQIIKANLGTVCFDLPLAGDSYDVQQKDSNDIRQYYEYYIDKIFEFLKLKFDGCNYIFSSISVGCMPVLEFSERRNIRDVVLLSPNHLEGEFGILNKSNVKEYLFKLLSKETWVKAFSLKLNFRKILNNIFRLKKHISKRNQYSPINNLSKVNLLCVFGEKDSGLPINLKFWNKNQANNRFLSYKEVLVPNSDHSFMGWKVKQELVKEVKDWIGK